MQSNEIPLCLTGYIHEFEISNSYNIPFDVVHIIWNYCKRVNFEWDQNNTTKHATFLSKEKVSFSAFGIVIGNIILSKDMYKKYSYSIKIDKVGNDSLFYGFVCAPFKKSIADWNTYYYSGDNRTHDIGKRQIAVEVWNFKHSICACGGNFTNFENNTYYYYGGYAKSIYSTAYKLKDGDIFKCQVDFDKETAIFFVDQYKVVHDGINQDIIPSICAPASTTISLCDFHCVLR
eukprot:241150_1